MKFLLRDFNAKLGNKCLHQANNDNGVRTVKMAHQKVWLLRARCSHAETYISTPRPLLMGRLRTKLTTLIDRRWHSSILDVRSFRGVECDNDHYLVVAKVVKVSQ
jgi:hypothetical protein